MDTNTFQNIDLSENLNPLKVENDLLKQNNKPDLPKKSFSFKSLPTKFLILLALGAVLFLLLIAAAIVKIVGTSKIPFVSKKAVPTPQEYNADVQIIIPPAHQPRINNIDNHITQKLQLPQLNIDADIGQ